MPERIYAIPEGVGQRDILVIGSKSARQLDAEMTQAGILIRDPAREMLYHPTFSKTILETPKELEIVTLQVRDLKFRRRPTTGRLFKRIRECRIGNLVLDLCPAEAGPHRRLKDKNQPLGDLYYIAMQQIEDNHRDPRVFALGHDGRILWLTGQLVTPNYRWGLDDRLVCVLREPQPSDQYDTLWEKAADREGDSSSVIISGACSSSSFQYTSPAIPNIEAHFFKLSDAAAFRSSAIETGSPVFLLNLISAPPNCPLVMV